MTEKIYLGLVGPKGAGKGTFIKILDELLADYSVERISSGDMLGEIADVLGKPRTRETLQAISPALEQVFGEGVVSETITGRMGESEADIPIFDGVRWDSDVAELRNLGEESGAKTALVYVTADTRLRYERAKERREKAGEDTATFEEFLEQEKASTEVNIKCIGEEEADFTIENNGTEEEMRLQARMFIQNVLDIPAFRRVILETPYAGETPEEIERNERFARACMRDCLLRGEAPYASHLLYTQPGVLDDKNKQERRLGIEAGFLWRQGADATVIYMDRGMSKGMKQGAEDAEDKGRPVEYRHLYG